jgi:alpha-glucosidase
VRVPMPWEGDEPPFGFSDTPDTLLPIPPSWAGLTVERQLRDSDSTLNFWRRALRLRHERVELSGTTLEWLNAPADAVIFRVAGGLVCALNVGAKPIPLPDGELLLASRPVADGRLPPGAAAWLVTRP